MASPRPRIPRDVRLLLAIGLVSIATLWALARIRFPDRASAPSPVPRVLAQLAATSPFDGIATSIAVLESRLQPWILAIQVERLSDPNGTAISETVLAIRLREDQAFVWLDPSATWGSEGRIIGVNEIARDPASHLAVLKVASPSALALTAWTPRDLDYPRFLVESIPTGTGFVLRPVFAGSLQEITSPVWRGPVWAFPAGTAITPGSWVFTTEGAFAGLALELDGRPSLVSGAALVGMADRLSRQGPTHQGWLGIDVDAIGPALAQATGARAGVIVSWLDENGPAHGQLQVTDVIESANGVSVDGAESWRAFAARLTEGESVELGVRRRDIVLQVHMTATARAAPDETKGLGLGLQTRAGVGAEVVRIDPGSAAEAAGLRAGDVLTTVGGMNAPTATQAIRALATGGSGQAIVIVFTRGHAHRVLALARKW